LAGPEPVARPEKTRQGLKPPMPLSADGDAVQLQGLKKPDRD